MNLYESGPDPRAGHALDAVVCHPHDPGGSAAAVLQCRRHPDRRPVRRHRRAGGRRLFLHPDDLFDLYPAGSVHGQRGAVLDALRPPGRGGPAGEPGLFLCPDRRGDGGAQRGVLRLPGPDPGLSAGAGPGLGADAQLSGHHLYRHPGHLFVQLLRLLPAGGGQQRGAPGVSGGVGAAEHRPGPVVRLGAGAQRGRRRRSHRHLPVRLGRHRSKPPSSPSTSRASASCSIPWPAAASSGAWAGTCTSGPPACGRWPAIPF